MTMRLIFAGFLIAFGFYLISGHTTRHIALRRILFVTFVGAGILSLVFQELWTNISQFFGVENGTALLTYLVTISFISYVSSSYRWRRVMEEKISVLARNQAIEEYERRN